MKTHGEDVADLEDLRARLKTCRRHELIAECQAFLRRHPGHAGGEQLLAESLVETGHESLAVLVITGLLATVGESVSLIMTQARAFLRMGDDAAAEQSLRRALELDPTALPPKRGLIRLLVDRERGAEALEVAEALMHQDAEDPRNRAAAALALRARGRILDARALFRSALDAEPDLASSFLLRGLRARQDGNVHVAIAHIEELLDLAPEHAEGEHLLAALRGDETKARADVRYLREHFDRYAPKFEAHLSRELDYCAPQALAKALTPWLASRGRGATDIVDIGCGTGLCAAHLGLWAGTMVGVDISSGMLLEAERSGRYDKLEESEVQLWLEQHPRSTDVVVAGDVLIYFGDVTDLVAAMAEAIRPDGRVAVSIETIEDVPFRLGPGGRWAHSLQHVKRAFALAGLTDAEITSFDLRLEHGAAVEGATVVARRPS